MAVTKKIVYEEIIRANHDAESNENRQWNIPFRKKTAVPMPKLHICSTHFVDNVTQWLSQPWQIADIGIWRVSELS